MPKIGKCLQTPPPLFKTELRAESIRGLNFETLPTGKPLILLNIVGKRGLPGGGGLKILKIQPSN